MRQILTVGKRKKAIARAKIESGSGKVKINRVPVDLFMPEVLRMMIREPLIIAGDVSKKVDISVNVRGGGVIGQAQAARTAIAKALVEFSKSDDLKKKFAEYDKTLLVSDVRTREPRKPFGHGKARAKRQKSYR